MQSYHKPKVVTSSLSPFLIYSNSLNLATAFHILAVDFPTSSAAFSPLSLSRALSPPFLTGPSSSIQGLQHLILPPPPQGSIGAAPELPHGHAQFSTLFRLPHLQGFQH